MDIEATLFVKNQITKYYSNCLVIPQTLRTLQRYLFLFPSSLASIWERLRGPLTVVTLHQRPLYEDSIWMLTRIGSSRHCLGVRITRPPLLLRYTTLFFSFSPQPPISRFSRFLLLPISARFCNPLCDRLDYHFSSVPRVSLSLFPISLNLSKDNWTLLEIMERSHTRYVSQDSFHYRWNRNNFLSLEWTRLYIPVLIPRAVCGFLFIRFPPRDISHSKVCCIVWPSGIYPQKQQYRLTFLLRNRLNIVMYFPCYAKSSVFLFFMNSGQSIASHPYDDGAWITIQLWASHNNAFVKFERTSLVSSCGLHDPRVEEVVRQGVSFFPSRKDLRRT